MTAKQTTETPAIYTAKRLSRLFGLPLTLTHYVIDGEWLAECTGLFSANVKMVSLSQVRNMVVVQSAWQKLFGLSTVRVATADAAVPEFVVHNIHGGEAFAAKLQQALDKALSLRPMATE